MDMGVWRSGLGKQIGTSLYGKDLVIQGEAVARGSGQCSHRPGPCGGSAMRFSLSPRTL